MLPTDSHSVLTGLVIGTFVQQQHAPALELILAAYLLLHFANQQRP
jgi:ABC-type Mn2+/Zn2+ transport system permease subunit